MRTFTPFLIVAIVLTACGNHTSYVDHVSSNYYPGNEDKFGFLVLDKGCVDSFFLQYPGLSFQNEKLQKILSPCSVSIQTSSVGMTALPAILARLFLLISNWRWRYCSQPSLITEENTLHRKPELPFLLQMPAGCIQSQLAPGPVGRSGIQCYFFQFAEG